MAHYLVTGGAGFIGSHLCEELARRGHTVRVADSLITGQRSNLDHVKDVEFLEGDLADPDFAPRAVAGMDYVLHQAAIPSVPRSVKDPIASNRANVDATLNVLVAARDAGVKRLVFAGSSSAYGNTPTLPKREDMPSQSAVAVRAAEGRRRAVPADVHAAVRPRDRLDPLLQRLRAAPGSDSSPYSGVISVFATALIENRVADDPRRRRADPRLHLRRQRRRRRAARVRRARRERGSDQRRDRRADLAQPVVQDDAGRGRRDAWSRPTRTSAAGDVKDSQADIAKAQRLLGYQPIVSFEEGLKRTVEWYRTSAPAGVSA